MGRRMTEDKWLIDEVIGPGPLARHSRFRFSPDIDYQHAEIAARYRATDGASTYIGDWHSHPGARHGGLSYLDRKALRRVMDEPSAQCPEPLMMILWGEPNEWSVSAWQTLSGSVGLLSRVPRVHPCTVLVR